MKNFSEALDIDTQDQLCLHLVICTHGHINYRMRLNGHLISDSDTEYRVDLFSKIRLTCQVFDTDTGAVEICEFSVNGVEILPRYQHLAQPATAWIDQAGAWTFQIDPPFYPWYHEISGQGWIA